MVREVSTLLRHITSKSNPWVFVTPGQFHRFVSTRLCVFTPKDRALLTAGLKGKGGESPCGRKPVSTSHFTISRNLQTIQMYLVSPHPGLPLLENTQLQDFLKPAPIQFRRHLGCLFTISTGPYGHGNIGSYSDTVGLRKA